MIRVALPACLLLAAPLAAPVAAQQRIPIDLGPDAPTAASPPPQIDILVPPPQPGEPTAAMIKECDDRREAGVVAGEIVVCRELSEPGAYYFSGNREAWLRGFGERTQGANTIPAPDVAGPGIFRGEASIGGLCFIPPCPKGPALIIDVTAIPPPPAGSDAERVAKGLTPVEDDMAALSAEERRRKEADLGLPPAPGTAE
jgi:hypothetical protein